MNYFDSFQIKWKFTLLYYLCDYNFVSWMNYFEIINMKHLVFRTYSIWPYQLSFSLYLWFKITKHVNNNLTITRHFKSKNFFSCGRMSLIPLCLYIGNVQCEIIVTLCTVKSMWSVKWVCCYWLSTLNIRVCINVKIYF
jgi:hypothetical protein